MDATAPELLDRARDLAKRGEFRASLERFQALCDREPYNPELWLEMADVAETAKLIDEAVAAMFHVADVFARAGMAEAADVAERVLTLDPTHIGARRFVNMFKTRRLGVTVPDYAVLTPGTQTPSITNAVDSSLTPAHQSAQDASRQLSYMTGDDDSVVMAVRNAQSHDSTPLASMSPSQINISDIDNSPDPLLTVAPDDAFSGLEKVRLVQSLLASTTSRFVDALDESAVQALIETADLQRRKRGDIIFREGEPGARLYIILKGSMDVERLDATGTSRKLATLGPGAFFGEMAIVAGSPRSATVRASADSIMLEVARESVQQLSESDPDVRDLLMRFFRARLVGTLMATSPLFTPMSVDERRSLVGRFRMRELPPHRTILQQDQQSDGLYLVLVGKLGAFVEDTQGSVVEIGQLGSGDVFGEMSFMTGEPPMASIITIERSWVLRLPKDDLDHVIRSHPEVLRQLNQIAERRQAKNRATLDDD